MHSGLALIVAAFLFSLPQLASSADLAACDATLGRLERVAGHTKRAAEEAESDCSEYRECRPADSDVCSNKRLRCDGSKDNLESRLRELAISINSVERACRVNFSAIAKGSRKGSNTAP
jgi:hypothetical protein